MTFQLLISLLFGGFVSCDFQRGQFVDELLVDYEPTFPPIENLSEYIAVNMEVKIISVDFVSETDQYLEARLHLKMIWNDSLIKWNITDEETPDFIHLPNEKLWTPRVVVKNSVQGGYNLVDNENLIVFAEGSIMWSTLFHMKTSCKINISKFPFDQQICTVTFSPAYRKFSHFVLYPHEGEDSADTFTESSEWHLTGTKIHKELYLDSFYGDLKKGDILFDVVLERRYVFHIFKGILPPVCLSFMNCFVFRLPAGDGERITMSISVLLSYTLYLSFINESLPENSDTVCIFSVYLSCLFILSILIILATIYSIILHQHVKNNNGQTPIEKISKGPEEYADEKSRKLRWLRDAKMYDKTVFRIFCGTTIGVTTICLTLMLH